ncbi:TRAP transporter large permease subunit [uncultured Desulfobacter sp.]|uniref:TRAP transporter large permease subunit n=1 Tax=uncultured Desulfobacter sp. TaxID=240139 RepID=UPI0029C90C37|nr:TRAP transporter large permease subunit [uncultured Desulfobacter sp.]
MTFIIIGLLIVFALMGAPLFTVIIAAAMYGFYLADIDLSVMAIELYRIADTPILLALPLFTFAGYVLGESNTSQRLVTLTRAFLGWMPGGLAIVAFVVCAVFTAFTGASGVTIVAMGALLYPALTQAGYTDRFSLGLVTTSGSLGLLLPPSLPLILYGIIAQQMNGGEQVSIENLFLAGLFPALLMIVMLSIWSVWANRGNQVPLTRFSVGNCLSALKAAGWEVPLPLVVFFGIYSGYFAVSEYWWWKCLFTEKSRLKSFPASSGNPWLWWAVSC